MRCTNKKKLAALVVLSVLLTGCKSAAVSMEYELDSPVSAYRIDHTNSIADDKAEGFAADLCLRDGQTLSGNEVDLSQALSGVLCDLGKNRIIYGKDEYAARTGEPDKGNDGTCSTQVCRSGYRIDRIRKCKDQ